MNSVFVVQHSRAVPDDAEDIKFIGVYRTLDAALAAVERLKLQPGFCDFPRLVEPMKDDDEEGFYVSEYPLDKDHWTEGFFTWVPPAE